jgi:hypothetical protein
MQQNAQCQAEAKEIMYRFRANIRKRWTSLHERAIVGAAANRGVDNAG